jgi:RNA polymerase sigma-70 factor (ECF subfamily)
MTDNELMAEVKNGRVEKLAVLFERYHLLLYNFFLRLSGNRQNSEDLVQEVFTRILKYRATFQGEAKFSVWMYKIAHNAHIDHLRKRHPAFSLEDSFQEVPSREESPPESVEREAESALMARALSRLPAKKQEILVLSRFHNLKYREIATLTGTPEGTIKATVHRAIKELADIYGRLTEEACGHEV